MRAFQPHPHSKSPPVVSFRFPFSVSEVRRRTMGTMYSGLKCCRLFLSFVPESACARPPVLATGAIVLTLILCFKPSRAVDSERPRIPSFYVNNQHSSYFGCNSNAHSCRIIRLSKIAIYPAGAGGVDNGALSLLQEDWPYRFRHLVSAIEMHVEDHVPKVFSHVGERLIAHKSSIIDKDVDSAMNYNSFVNNLLAIFDRINHSCRLTTSLSYLTDNSSGIRPIIDNDRRSKSCKCNRISTTQPEIVSMSTTSSTRRS